MTERSAAQVAEALFERLVARFTADPSVTPPSAGQGGKFGASGLKVEGKLFAMISRGELVLKLPRERVDELVAAGKGKRFYPGHGRVINEWITIAVGESRQWSTLAEEARQFVSETARGSRR